MNLYDIHPDPKNAPGYDKRYDTVPELVWKRYMNQPEELKKREKVLAKDAEYAYQYANDVLKGPFPTGEAEIAKDTWFAYMYAKYVLQGPFHAGEAEIATDVYNAYHYARQVLELPEAEAKIWPKKLKESLLAELLELCPIRRTRC